jgi:uncharacterized membrane protein YfcA
MGDIIWGTSLIILILGVFGLYRFSTRKKVEQRSFPKFMSLLLILGGLIGVLTTALSERLSHEHHYIYFLTLIFFCLSDRSKHIVLQGNEWRTTSFSIDTPIANSDNTWY